MTDVTKPPRTFADKSNAPMRRYCFNDVAFSAPDDWLDLSIVTLARPGGSFAPSVVVSREDAPEQPLDAYARAQLPEIRRTVKKHELVAQNALLVAGREAYLLEHRFVTPEKVVARQSQYFIRAGQELLILSLTCAETELSTQTPLFERVVASFQIGASDAP